MKSELTTAKDDLAKSENTVNDWKEKHKQLKEERNEKLANKEQKIINQSKLLAKKDKQIANQSQTLAKKEELITQQSKQLTKKEEIITKLSKQLNEKDEQIKNQSEILNKKDKQITEYEKERINVIEPVFKCVLQLRGLTPSIDDIYNKLLSNTVTPPPLKKRRVDNFNTINEFDDRRTLNL